MKKKVEKKKNKQLATLFFLPSIAVVASRL